MTLLVGVIVWGVLHLHQSQRVAGEAIRRLAMDDVEALRMECEAVFLRCFNETLSLDKLEASTRTLSARLDDAESLKNAFAKAGFYWYFALPVGACLGELIRVHANGQWQASEEGGSNYACHFTVTVTSPLPTRSTK